MRPYTNSICSTMPLFMLKKLGGIFIQICNFYCNATFSHYSVINILNANVHLLDCTESSWHKQALNSSMR